MPASLLAPRGPAAPLRGRSAAPLAGRPPAAAAAPPATFTHHLYVLTGGGAPQESTVRILQFIARCKPWLGAMRINFKVQKVEPAMLRNSRVVAAFEGKGITEFPALKTGEAVYLGAEKIARAYAQAIDGFKQRQAAGGARPAAGGPPSATDIALGRQGVSAPVGSSQDLYRTYFKEEWDPEQRGKEGGDEGISGDQSENMMKKYQEMVKRRAGMETRRKGGSAPAPPPPPRKNVAASQPDEDKISSLIDTLEAPVTAKTIQEAHKGHGSSPDDELMLKFWENQSETRI